MLVPHAQNSGLTLKQCVSFYVPHFSTKLHTQRSRTEKSLSVREVYVFFCETPTCPLAARGSGGCASSAPGACGGSWSATASAGLVSRWAPPSASAACCWNWAAAAGSAPPAGAPPPGRTRHRAPSCPPACALAATYLGANAARSSRSRAEDCETKSQISPLSVAPLGDTLAFFSLHHNRKKRSSQQNNLVVSFSSVSWDGARWSK